jgi:tRNA(Ile)-lysidine synthetase-like protein
VEETHAALLVRFKRATLRRLQDAQGRTWRDGEELLAHHAFAADEAPLLREPLSQTARARSVIRSASHKHWRTDAPVAQVAAFVARHGAASAATPRAPPAAAAAELPVAACVSLSGGVDSMVLALILSRLGAGRWRVAGAHIDYGNRPESGAEAAFVAAWCAEQGIVFRLKRITELRRGISGRDEYERESRALRYNFYAACLAEWPACGGMCVGHHAGDVQENVITNLLKGTSLLAISGMTEVSRVNGVPVWCGLLYALSRFCYGALNALVPRRPLLPWDKDTIFAFAHRYGVPYFRCALPCHQRYAGSACGACMLTRARRSDTTPTWSTRGKLRRQVLPLLHEVFGEGASGAGKRTQHQDQPLTAHFLPVVASLPHRRDAQPVHHQRRRGTAVRHGARRAAGALLGGGRCKRYRRVVRRCAMAGAAAALLEGGPEAHLPRPWRRPGQGKGRHRSAAASAAVRAVCACSLHLRCG